MMIEEDTRMRMAFLGVMGPTSMHVWTKHCVGLKCKNINVTLDGRDVSVASLGPRIPYKDKH